MAASRTPTKKQALVAAISATGAGLSFSKNTINGLAKFAVNADEKSVAELLALISQPDPCNSLKHVIPPKIREVHADWDDVTEEDFAQWVANAVICYHQIDEYLNRHSSYHDENPENDRLTARFVQGMQHYRDANPDCTSEQLTDLAMLAAAAHSAYFNHLRRTGNAPLPDITAGSLCGHTWCHSLGSAKIIDLATSSHETAQRILSIITDEGIATEAHILYRLENGPQALRDGVI